MPRKNSGLVDMLTGARDKFMDLAGKAEHLGQKYLSQPVFGPKKKLRLDQAGMPAKTAEAAAPPMEPETKGWKSKKHQTKTR